VNSKITGTDFFRTSLNSTASPLLRLPAELRNQIWHLAFGEKMLYVSARRDPTNRRKRPQLDYFLYDSVLEQRIDRTTQHSHRSFLGAPQPVCRQYWAEASHAFFSSCVLVVDRNSSTAFPIFVQFGGPIVSQIRRLIVYNSNLSFPLPWHSVFKTALVGRLTSLEGVSVSGNLTWFSAGDPRVTHSMGEHFRSGALVTFIRSFQQHELKEELTTVDLQPSGEMMDRAATVGAVNDAIRERLLRYCPLRRSRRNV
jgi:hypothetical protein